MTKESIIITGLASFVAGAAAVLAWQRMRKKEDRKHGKEGFFFSSSYHCLVYTHTHTHTHNHANVSAYCVVDVEAMFLWVRTWPSPTLLRPLIVVL